MLRSLIHYGRTHAAVVAGTAVAAAVLTGALLVGDSVRGSLRDLARDGLGDIDHALLGERFVPEDLADRVAALPDASARMNVVAPAILLRGDARHPSSGARASDVRIQAADDRFLGLMRGVSTSAELFGDGPSVFPPVAINASLARELGVEEGDQMLLSLGRWSDIPSGSLLGRKDTGDVVEVLRTQVATVLEDRGAGRFSLEPHQTQARVAWLPLDVVQKELDQVGRVNTLLFDAREDSESADDASLLASFVRDAATVDDLGLRLSRHEGAVVLESDRFVMRGDQLDATRRIAETTGASVLPVSTYLANGLTLVDADGTAVATVPYSTVAALDPGSPAASGGLETLAGEPIRELASGEIVLDSWSAENLGAEPGDTIRLDYWEVDADENLREVSAELVVRSVAAKSGLAADAELTQEYPGIADAERMSDWDPPFPVELNRVHPVDEEYWDEWRGTPKAFVALEWGQERWRTVWGDLTQLRIVPAAGDATEIESLLRRELPRALDAGFRVEPVRDRALRAASGTTDFGQLFLGFSFFLIGAAAMLVGQLFRLGVEQRAGEIGLRLAVGFRPATVRRQLLAEGAVLAGLGSALGLVGAVVYAGAMIAGLRTLWRPAVGTSHLSLHVPPASLVIGGLISMAVVVFVVYRAVRRVGDVPVPRLLAGRPEQPDAQPARTARRVALVALPVAAIVLVGGALAPEGLPPAAFFVAGPLLLVGLLALLGARLDGLTGRGLDVARPRALARVAAGNAARHRGRSLLAASAIAAAAFVLVTVAAFEHDFRAEDPSRIPGTGGFDLLAESEIGLRYDLSDPDQREDLGLGGEARSALDTARILPFLRRPGDDASCLNLYRPEQPRLLGVPTTDLQESSFEFANTIDDGVDPWTLLRREEPDGAIPVIGDANSTQWILKLGLGDVLELPGDDGRTLRLRLVATLATSVFQSELLLDAERFREVFPERTGDAVFLLDAPTADDARALSSLLEKDLAPYGFDAIATVDHLADFHVVQNTYLQTFQLLGGLGLLLGTIGLAFVLLRNVLERRGELATLRALGFRGRTLLALVVGENALLLVAGLGVGALAALVTAGPRLLHDPSQIPWSGLAVTLGAVLATGFASCLLAAAVSMRDDLTPALKAE